MIQKRIEKLLKDIAKEHDKSYEVIYEVYMSQFRLTRETIRSLEFKIIKLPSLGKFIAGGEKTIKFKDKLNYFYDRYESQNNQNTPLQGEE